MAIVGNLHRRHLTSSQRAMVAQKMLPMLEAEARERQTLGKELPKPDGYTPDDGKAVSQAAKLTGTNRQYINDAKRLVAEHPEIAERVQRGRWRFPHLATAHMRSQPARGATCPDCQTLTLSRRITRARARGVNWLVSASFPASCLMPTDGIASEGLRAGGRGCSVMGLATCQ